MFQRISLKGPDNPILKRISQPNTGPTPRQFLTSAFGITLGVMAVLLLLYRFDTLTTILTVLQIAALPTTFILTIAIVLSTTIITVRETQGEPFELLRMTTISSVRMVWGLSGGIFYRLRKTMLGFVWSIVLALLPIMLRIREIEIDGPRILPNTLFVELPLLICLIFCAASGIAFMLVTSAVLTALRFRSVAFAAAITLLSTGIVLLGGFVLWLIVVSLAGGAVSMLLAVCLVPIPYGIGLIFARRWRTDQLRLIAVTAHAPVAVLVFVLFTAILGFGLGKADQSDTILFWAMNGVFSFFLVLSIQSEWGQSSGPELIALLAWQALLVVILGVGEVADSDIGFETVVWLVSDALLVTPFAVAIGNIDRARRWVWGGKQM